MGFLTIISHPSNGPFWSNAKAWQSQKEIKKIMVGEKKKISKRVREKGTPKAERVWHETLSTTEESLTGNRPWLDFFGRHS